MVSTKPRMGRFNRWSMGRATILFRKGYSPEQISEHLFQRYGKKWKISAVSQMHDYLFRGNPGKPNFTNMFVGKKPKQVVKAFWEWRKRNIQLHRQKSATIKKMLQDPVISKRANEKSAARLKQLHATPEFATANRARAIAHMRRLRQDPTFVAESLQRLAAYRSSPENKSRSSALLKRMNSASNSQATSATTGKSELSNLEFARRRIAGIRRYFSDPANAPVYRETRQKSVVKTNAIKAERQEVVRRITNDFENGHYDNIVFAAIRKVTGGRGTVANQDDDIAQEVRIHILDNVIKKFNPKRGSIEALISTAARRKTIDLLRFDTAEKRGGGKVMGLESEAMAGVSDRTPNGASPLEMVANQGESESIERVLAGLPNEQRRLLELRFVRDQTLQQIATKLRITVKQAKYRLAVAAVAFREEYQKKYPQRYLSEVA